MNMYRNTYALAWHTNISHNLQIYMEHIRFVYTKEHQIPFLLNKPFHERIYIVICIHMRNASVYCVYHVAMIIIYFC